MARILKKIAIFVQAPFQGDLRICPMKMGKNPVFPLFSAIFSKKLQFFAIFCTSLSAVYVPLFGHFTVCLY